LKQLHSSGEPTSVGGLSFFGETAYLDDFGDTPYVVLQNYGIVK